MCRLRRQKLEVVIPAAQGDKYRSAEAIVAGHELDAEEVDSDEPESEAEEEDEKPTRGKKTKVEWIEDIPSGRFFLRVGLGRKASGSYYTPHSFVRFLVQETLGPQVAERSPQDDPNPLEILKLKVLDPAMGSGHFLVEACRFLGDKLYEACRLCDEKALEAERNAERVKTKDERDAALKLANEYRRRVIDLPDPDDEMLSYLPSRSPEGKESGYSQRRAEALCRRLVATHCLYGVDKNPLAVELAKLALWLESHAEGMPLTFLDHRLVVGDSLTGPFWEKLLFRPVNPSERVEGLFHQGLSQKLSDALQEAIRHVRDLEASVGVTVSEIQHKEQLKEKLDRALLPFRVAAAAWSGGVMLGSGQCDDMAYADLVKSIATSGDLPDTIESPDLRQMIARGLSVEDLPAERTALYTLMRRAHLVPALSFDLTFPEVFYPTGVPDSRQGFNAVLGNPPWDRMLPADKEFFAAFEFRILDAPTKRERDVIQRQLLADPSIKRQYDAYIAAFRNSERVLDSQYTYQIVQVDGERTIGKQDAFRAFMERNTQLLANKGWTGIVVPSAFHANEGASGVRRLYLERLNLRHCYSFENKRKLFEIHSSFKFATVVAQAGQPTDEFSCAFYLHDDEWLFGSRSDREPLMYQLAFVRRTGGEYMNLLELRSPRDFEIAEMCFAKGEPFGQVCERLGIRLGREVNMTDDAWRFMPTAKVLTNGEDPRDPDVAARLLQMGYLVLHEGKTFCQYDDHWGIHPRYIVALKTLEDRPIILRRTRHYRVGYRDIAGPGDENVAIFNMHPPGITTGHTAPLEAEPFSLPGWVGLCALAVLNTHVFDWLLQLRVRSHLNLFMLLATPVPRPALHQSC